MARNPELRRGIVGRIGVRIPSLVVLQTGIGVEEEAS